VSDTWQCEVTVAALTYTGPTSGLLPGSVGISYTFSAIDASGFQPVIHVTLEQTGTDLRVREFHGLVIGGNPFSVTAHASFNSGVGVLTAFTSGGLLKIVKDEAAAEFQYTGFLGTSTLTFATLGSIPDGEMSPDMIGLRSETVFTGTLFAPVANGTTLAVPFDNFWGSKNGTHIKGADLGTTDRGTWLAFAGPPAPWEVVNTNATLTEPSTATDIVGQIVSPATPTANARMVRHWDQTAYLIAAGGTGLLDMTHAREHGAHWAIIVYPTAPDVVRNRRTFDKGNSWLEQDLFSAGGTTNRSVSITWYYGRLVSVWQRDGDIVQSVSSDAGASWGSPVVVIASGTNPRHIVDPAHGIGFFFYCVGNDLLLKRSADYGASFIEGSPISVATGIGAQTVAAQFGPDGSLIVGYVVAGAWTQVRSTDYGVSWS
jgi:hypothetical protein